MIAKSLNRKKFIKKSCCRILIFLAINIINYFCLWYFLNYIGIDTFRAIGYMDTFGYVWPPKWFFLVTVFISLIEYMALTTLFPLKKTYGQSLL